MRPARLLGCCALASIAIASMSMETVAAPDGVPSVPNLFIQVGHTTPWTHPLPATKYASINGPPAAPTAYWIDDNVDHVSLRLKEQNLNTTGHVRGTDATHALPIEVTFDVESSTLSVDTDLLVYTGNSSDPRFDPLAQPLVPLAAVPNGQRYVVTIPAGSNLWNIHLRFLQAPLPNTVTDIHEVYYRFHSAEEIGGQNRRVTAGWNRDARFVVEAYDPALALTPAATPPGGPRYYLHFEPVQATPKIPHMGVEVLDEGRASGYGPGGGNEYQWQRIVLRDGNLQTEPPPGLPGENTYKPGGNTPNAASRYTVAVDITIHQGLSTDLAGELSAPPLYSRATAGVDFELVDESGTVIPPQATSPTSWNVRLSAGSSSARFGVRVIDEPGLPIDEQGWEELILVIGDPSAGSAAQFLGTPMGSTVQTAEPLEGWHDRIRFLIKDNVASAFAGSRVLARNER